MEWNERLKQARKSRRWTQDVLAEKLGTNRSTISRWEKGNDFPYPIHREKLTELLGTIFDDVKASAIYRNEDLKLSALISEREQAHYERHASQTLLRPEVYVHRTMLSLSSGEHFPVLSDTDTQSLGLQQEALQEPQASSLVKYEQACQQDKPASRGQFFSLLALWGICLHHMRHALPFRAFHRPYSGSQRARETNTQTKALPFTTTPTGMESHRFSWSPVLFVSIILLATLTILLMFPAFRILPLPGGVQSTNNLIDTIIAQAGKSYEAEAEVNTLVGRAIASNCSLCSGSKKVRFLGVDSTKKTTGALQFNDVSEQSTATYKLTIYYINGRVDRALYMSVNHGPVIVLNAPSTGDWKALGTITTTVHLNAGNNTIIFYNPSSYAPDIDRIVVSSGSSSSVKQNHKGQSSPLTTAIDDSVQGTATNQFNYVGHSWGHCTIDNCGEKHGSLYKGTNSWDDTPNDYVTVTFTGVQIRFYGVVDTLHGIGAVSLDGGTEKMIDFYSAIRIGNDLLWTSPTLPQGTHTFKLRVTGNKNPGSSNGVVVVDHVDILS